MIECCILKFTFNRIFISRKYGANINHITKKSKITIVYLV